MRMMHMALAALLSLAAEANDLAGRVVRVADGDTLTVLDCSNVQHRVRLNRIDAPEKGQAFGEVSRKRLASMVAGKDVAVAWEKTDKYGRILGDVTCCSTNVNLQMVKDGLAWHYKQFDSTQSYADAEKSAREKRLGLWKDKDPEPPHEYRKRNKK